jgi:hypothetical protein
MLVRKSTRLDSKSQPRQFIYERKTMGQAKARGSQDERAAHAKARIEARKPASITCNHCKAEIKDIHVMDARGIEGIEEAYVGTCDACGNSTFALRGEPDAVANAMVAIEQSMEDGGAFGREESVKRQELE